MRVQGLFFAGVGALLLSGCIVQDDPTLTTGDGNAPFQTGAALQCFVEDSGKTSCHPYRITRASVGPAAMEASYMGGAHNLQTEGALFHQLPTRPDNRYTLEVILKTNKGYGFVPAVGWMTRPDSMQIYVPDCYKMLEEFPDVMRLVSEGLIDRQCKSSSANNRYQLFLTMTRLPKERLYKVSTEHRLTAVSMAVAQERMQTIQAEANAANAKSELTLNIERTAAREYVAAYGARAQMQSNTEVYYGAPFIGTLYQVSFSATNVKCSPVRENKTTCSWAHNVKVRSVNELFAALAWNAPLMKDETLTREFVFTGGKWTSPSLRALYISRDGPASVPSSGPNGLDVTIDAQRRSACASAMMSSSSFGEVARGFNC